MNNIGRNIIIGVAAIVILFIMWYFKNIISYILIALVLSLIGKPVVDFLGKLKIKNFVLPKWIRALVALLFVWALFILFFIVFIPMIVKEASELSNVDITPLIAQLDAPLQKLNYLFVHFNIGGGDYASIEEYLMDKVYAIMNISLLSSILGTLTSLMGDIFIAVFAISFIMFFFLKDEKMFANGILLLTPSKHENAIQNALRSTKKLLTRYFIGIGFQVTAIIILVTLGLSIVGLDFQRAAVIGLFVGIINIIPYVGPFIGAFVGVIIGSASYIDMEMSILLAKILWMAIVFITVQLLDNIVFQPLIYGTSVNAHPLEIFLVILIAGSVAGIPGMILAIPTYTILRVFAREFFNKFKVVKKITENIPTNNT